MAGKLKLLLPVVIATYGCPSIPKRRELIKEAARDPSTTQAKEIQSEQQEHYWRHCALSNQPLSSPVVSDAVGKLYNKDAVLEALIVNGSNNAENKSKVDHISSLKDIVEVRFSSEEDSDGKNERRSPASKWVCPVTNKSLGPGVKAVYLVPCGHAFSENAVKEVAGDVCLEVRSLNVCVNGSTAAKIFQCNEPYNPENVITILPISNKDKDRLKSRILKLREQGLTHSLKKVQGASKKRKKHDTAHGVSIAEAIDVGAKSSQPKHLNESAANGTNGIRNAGTASLTARVLAEQEDRNKRRKIVENENLKGLFSSSNGETKLHTDFMTRGFSIPTGAKR